MSVVNRGDAEIVGAGVGDAPTLAGRAAQYVRMSTDHQKYSTENQARSDPAIR
jgi:hypothetical protein